MLKMSLNNKKISVSVKTYRKLIDPLKERGRRTERKGGGRGRGAMKGGRKGRKSKRKRLMDVCGV